MQDLWQKLAGVWTAAEWSVKKNPLTLGELNSPTPFASGLHGSGLDKVAEKTSERQTDLRNSLYYSKKRWLYFNAKTLRYLSWTRQMALLWICIRVWQSRIITTFLPLFGPGWCWVLRLVQQRPSVNITLSTYLQRREEMIKIFGPNILIKPFFVFRCCRFGCKSGQGWDNSAGLNSPWCCSGACSLTAPPAFSHAITSTSCASILSFIPVPSRNCLSQSSTED